MAVHAQLYGNVLVFSLTYDYFYNKCKRRNLCAREDAAKYLWNLDVNSAHFNPKLDLCMRTLVQMQIQMRSSMG